MGPPLRTWVLRLADPKWRCIASALVAVALAFAPEGAAVASETHHQRVQVAGEPVWTVDLNEQGYRWYNDAHGAGGDEDTDIAFGSNTDLVVLGYDTNVRAFVIDPQSGKVSRTREWPRRSGSAVFATDGGNYAVLDKGTVVYGPGLVDEVARSPQWVSLVSPNGRRFAASTHPVKETVWITMDAETLAETGVISAFHEGSLAERSIATLVVGRQQGPLVEIETIGRDPVIYQPKWGTGYPVFASENVVVVLGPDCFDVITIDGELLFSGPGGWQEETHISTSRDGRRMAVTRGHYSGHMRRELKSEQVTVFDLRAKASIWTVEHKGMKGAFMEHSGVALSPDGTLLAISSRGHVRLFRMPGTDVD